MTTKLAFAFGACFGAGYAPIAPYSEIPDEEPEKNGDH